jgi:hypothetical protein
LKKWFSPLNIIKTPQVLKRWSIEKIEREKEEEKVLKIKERERLQESLQIKGEVNILRGGKHFNIENLFYMIPFSPPPSYHFENLFQIIEKVFVTLFGPSFSLVIYMTWVVSFLLTHELHIFSL